MSCGGAAHAPRAMRTAQAWQLSGDAYATHPGDKPWISEMYGYSFGAAKADVWHKYHTTAMIYPGYLPIGAAFSVRALRCAQVRRRLSNKGTLTK